MGVVVTILLTGGAGYIGTHTAVVLLAAGHDVVLLDNLCNSSRDTLGRLARITGRDVPLIQADVRDTARVAQALRDHACTAVVHFAGLKAVGESVQKPIDYFANNVQGTVSLLQAMQGTGVRHLVFSSSATVYGAPQYLPLDEQHPTSATNPYGRSKLHIEEILADLCVSDPAWRVACLRYFNPAGAHPSGLLGEDPQGIPNNLMPYVAKVAGGDLPRLGVFGNDYDTPDGTGVRDYIHVLDLAQGHLAALQFLQKQSGWHAINLGTGQGYSVLQMVRAFESASGKPVPYDIKPRRAGDIGTCYANAGKAKELLGWEATRGLQEMCDSMWLWQQRGKIGSNRV
jgi:UDP-glucose 4-epimerase